MYDKYTTATQFSVNGSQLPKHKGLLFLNTSQVSTGSATMQFLNTSGGTTNINFYVYPQSQQFIPMQAWAGITMPGVTGWLLN